MGYYGNEGKQITLILKASTFSHIGVDFFGPINVKLSRKTTANSAAAKRYGALFTCLTARAIRIEVCNDLSTDSFILALRHLKAEGDKLKYLL